MSEYNNSGILFKNDKEGKSTNFPDYGGSARVGSVEYYISAWIKQGKKGKFMSVAFKPKEEEVVHKQVVKPNTYKDDEKKEGFDSEIPF